MPNDLAVDLALALDPSPVTWIDAKIHQNEIGHPFQLFPHQREILRHVFAYWDHEPRMPWQTPAYYAAQRRTLRAGTYLRLHENRWAVAETTFLTPELWDSCIDTARHPLPPQKTTTLFVGVDAATKHDTAAVMAVAWEGEQLTLASHQIWQPSPQQPLDLEATIERELRTLHQGFRVAAIFCDPWQLHNTIITACRPWSGLAPLAPAQMISIVRAFTGLKRHTVCDAELTHFCNERVVQASIPTQVFLTRKLWDVGNSAPYGHRGDLTTITEAIFHHGGEARSARDAFLNLPKPQQDEVVEFLKSLQVLPAGTDSLVVDEHGNSTR